MSEGKGESSSRSSSSSKRGSSDLSGVSGRVKSLIGFWSQVGRSLSSSTKSQKKSPPPMVPLVPAPPTNASSGNKSPQVNSKSTSTSTTSVPSSSGSSKGRSSSKGKRRASSSRRTKSSSTSASSSSGGKTPSLSTTPTPISPPPPTPDASTDAQSPPPPPTPTISLTAQTGVSPGSSPPESIPGAKPKSRSPAPRLSSLATRRNKDAPGMIFSSLDEKDYSEREHVKLTAIKRRLTPFQWRDTPQETLASYESVEIRGSDFAHLSTVWRLGIDETRSDADKWALAMLVGSRRLLVNLEQIGLLKRLAVIDLYAVYHWNPDLFGLPRLTKLRIASAPPFPRWLGLAKSLKELSVPTDVLPLPSTVGNLVLLEKLTIEPSVTVPTRGLLHEIVSTAPPIKASPIIIPAGAEGVDWPVHAPYLPQSLKSVVIRPMIETIPWSLRHLGGLEELDIGTIGGPEALEAISRWNETLTRLSLITLDVNLGPLRVGSMKKLEELELTAPAASHLPGDLGSALNLRKVKLNMKRLRELPRSVGLLYRLEEMEIDSPELEDIPGDIGRCSQLVVFLINRASKLKALPASLLNIPRINSQFQGTDNVMVSHFSALKVPGTRFLLPKSSEATMQVRVPSLKAIAGMFVARTMKPTTNDLPGDLLSYLEGSLMCSVCLKDFFEYRGAQLEYHGGILWRFEFCTETCAEGHRVGQIGSAKPLPNFTQISLGRPPSLDSVEKLMVFAPERHPKVPMPPLDLTKPLIPGGPLPEPPAQPVVDDDNHGNVEDEEDDGLLPPVSPRTPREEYERSRIVVFSPSAVQKLAASGHVSKKKGR